MDKNSQDKVIKAGFRIIRKDDYPQPRIKTKINNQGSDWRTLAKFDTKAARDRAFAELMEDELTISD
ncbi:MAG TPA: hypothetical protein H9937_04075 [Candidatus Alistipes stercorigallinarum]|jgi:hypothetical protein|nr:ssrA-binding protein [Prevotella sp. CAG:487]HJC17127.1 hypothetical protein [Candidatus Alistipes stercorigallinarum]